MDALQAWTETGIGAAAVALLWNVARNVITPHLEATTQALKALTSEIRQFRHELQKNINKPDTAPRTPLPNTVP